MKTIKDIQWASWKAQDLATLLFVIKDGQILLIHKKRGLGAGKINGPGGRIESGETPREAAIREVEEELLTTPSGLNAVGQLKFQFIDGYSIHGYVYTAADCDRPPRETDEAIPQWTPLEAIPFDKMWADDEYWFPLLLENRPFEGRFIFDGDRMLDYHLAELDHPGF